MNHRVVLVLLVPLVLLVGGCGRSWDWKLADLDRNSLDLGLFRGADTADELAEWVQNGDVVEARGTEEGSDLTVVVRYHYDGVTWTGRKVVESACYAFVPEDDSSVTFDRTDCP